MNSINKIFRSIKTPCLFKKKGLQHCLLVAIVVGVTSINVHPKSNASLSAIDQAILSQVKNSIGEKSQDGFKKQPRSKKRRQAINKQMTPNRYTQEIAQEKSLKEEIQPPSRIEKMFMAQTTINSKEVLRLVKPKKIKQTYSVQFGYNIFDELYVDDFSIEDIPIGPDYVLGPGDTIIINIWGKIEQTTEMTLDRKGRIYMPKIGHIPLMGVPFGKAAAVIKKKVSKIYVNFELSVTMKEPRHITVYILGESYNPGPHSIPSYGTAFHVLLSSGGIKRIGSLRNIQIIRNNKVFKTIDLYQYLVRGKKSHDSRLKDGDTIFIPPIGPVVEVKGEVTRPAIYEIKRNTAWDVITLAGGFVANSYQSRIQIIRKDKNGKANVQDVTGSSFKEIKNALSKKKIKNGDQIIVYPFVEELDAYVKIEGHIYRPGQYQFRKGLTLEKLFTHAEGLKKDAYTKRVDIYRYISDDSRKMIYVSIANKAGLKTKIKNKDIIRVYSNIEKKGSQIVRVEGVVKNPGKYRLLSNMTIYDAAFLAGVKNIDEETEIEVYRQYPTGQQVIKKVNYQTLLLDSTSTHNIRLKHNDYIVVRQKMLGREKIVVKLTGEVVFPGKYFAKQGDRLSTIIARAGGYKKDAFLKGGIYTRKSVRVRYKLGYEKMLEDEKKRVMLDQTYLDSISINPAAALTIQATREKALDLLKNEMKSNQGRISITLSDHSTFANSHNDLMVMDGDTLHIPKTPTSVQVVGGIQNQSATLFFPFKSYQYYIAQSGGFTQFADKDKVIIFKPNGMVKERGVVGPGDIIYVPESIKIKFNLMTAIKNITEILANMGIAISAIQTLSN